MSNEQPMMRLETGRLSVAGVGDAEAEGVLRVYEACTDYLALQTPEPPSMEMVRSDLRAAAQHQGVFAGIFLRESNELIGVIGFVPHSFRGQRDYAFVLNLMIGAAHRRHGFGTEAYQAVEALIWRDAEVTRIGTLLLPQHEPSYAFAAKLGFERAGGPFKNKRGYGLWAFAKKRPGLIETPGEAIWRETKKLLGDSER
jgi:RimJ/RimL family protein N-acetyltransferase